MTVKDWMEKYCRDRGMFPDQANDVVSAVMATLAPMAGRWDTQIEDYPAFLVAAIAMRINAEALRYIDAECPKAFFRGMFA